MTNTPSASERATALLRAIVTELHDIDEAYWTHRLYGLVERAEEHLAERPRIPPLPRVTTPIARLNPNLWPQLKEGHEGSAIPSGRAGHASHEARSGLRHPVTIPIARNEP